MQLSVLSIYSFFGAPKWWRDAASALLTSCVIIESEAPSLIESRSESPSMHTEYVHLQCVCISVITGWCRLITDKSTSTWLVPLQVMDYWECLFARTETVQISALDVEHDAHFLCTLVHGDDPQQVNKCSLNWEQMRMTFSVKHEESRLIWIFYYYHYCIHYFWNFNYCFISKALTFLLFLKIQFLLLKFGWSKKC